MPGLSGQGAEPVSQDDVVEGLCYAAEHPEGIDPRQFVGFLFQNASDRFGDARLRALAVDMGMLDWWGQTWENFRMGSRTPNWCKHWIKSHNLRLSLGVAIEDERLSFATRTVIGRWFRRFGSLLSRVRSRLVFNFDEAMLAVHLRRKKLIVA